jgi:peptidoglycan-associated lipoprotein
MRKSSVSILGRLLLMFVLVLGVSCAKKVATEQAPAAPPPVAKEQVKPAPPPAPPMVDKFAEAKKAFEAESIYFGFDESNLTPQAINSLDKKVAFLKEYPQVKVGIAGNCDERGSAKYNLALGERRANAAKNYLVKAGVAQGRVTTTSYGEEKRVCKEQTESCWEKCRRDDFVIQ